MTEIKVFTHNADGTVEESSFELDAETERMLADARAYYKRCREAGTPYWCICDEDTGGRSVTHERAYWKPDTYEGPACDGIHRKHGVMCADCGGYIQEG